MKDEFCVQHFPNKLIFDPLLQSELNQPSVWGRGCWNKVSFRVLMKKTLAEEKRNSTKTIVYSNPELSCLYRQIEPQSVLKRANSSNNARQSS